MTIEFDSKRLSEKERHFREFAVWPIFSELNTDSWLTNFESAERPIAERLLTSFIYFNEQMTDALLKAAIQKFYGLQRRKNSHNLRSASDFVHNTAFVICEGERPNPTDSGHIFARKLRDRLLVPEHQILRPVDALKKRTEFKWFVFIDDFTGSGNQFITTWMSDHSIEGSELSFAKFKAEPDQYFSYCCCIATALAVRNIKREAPIVTLSPAHTLCDDSSTLPPSSRFWDGYHMDDVLGTLHRVSERAGYQAEDGGQNDWRGFHRLGLALAFNHGIPDASLPIFYSTRNDWKPLIARPDHA